MAGVAATPAASLAAPPGVASVAKPCGAAGFCSCSATEHQGHGSEGQNCVNTQTVNTNKQAEECR